MVSSRFEAVESAEGAVQRLSLARTHLGRPVYRVSAYWVDDILIDTGPRHVRSPFLAWARSQRIDEVWITHHHEDHVGNVGPLQGLKEVRAVASATAIERARTHGPIPWYRRHTWGDPDPGRLEPAPRSLSTRRHRFDVVPVPGHTGGDLAYVERAEGWAFVGDLFLGTRQVVTRPKEDLRATLGSLERLLGMRPRMLFTGMRVFPDAVAALEARIRFLRDTLASLEALVGQGLSAVAARRRLLGRETLLHYWSGGDFAKQHFVRQLLAAGGQTAT